MFKLDSMLNVKCLCMYVYRYIDMDKPLYTITIF